MSHDRFFVGGRQSAESSLRILMNINEPQLAPTMSMCVHMRFGRN